MNSKYLSERKNRLTQKKKKMIIYISVAIILSIIAMYVFFASSSFKRGFKSFWSDVSGGINRTVYVYDHNGNQLRTYTGKFDIKENDTKVFFDMENGRRIAIYNAVVIAEEDID